MRKLIPLTLVLISNAVSAEEWVVLRESPEDGKSPPGILVDSTSITTLETGMRRARTKHDWLSRRTDLDVVGPKAESYMIFVRLYDCGKRLIREESMEPHLKDGSVRPLVLSNDPKWYPPPGNQAADPAIAFVCGWKSESPKPREESASTPNRALLAALWSLTTQPQAITLADLTKKLRIDPHDYKIDGSPRYYVLSALDGQTGNKARTPIRSLTFWSVAIVPGAQGTQELRMRFDDDVCISTNSVAPYVGSPVMTESFPCPDNPACSSEVSYFYAAGKNRADKRLAVGSQLRVPKKCSQDVVVAKTFDKDYWLALCPFSYNKQVRENVIVNVEKEHPEASASFDLQQPRIPDYSGPTMRLSFRGPDSALRVASLNVEIDRCDLSVIRSWVLSQPK